MIKHDDNFVIVLNAIWFNHFDIFDIFVQVITFEDNVLFITIKWYVSSQALCWAKYMHACSWKKVIYVTIVINIRTSMISTHQSFINISLLNANLLESLE